MDFCSKAPDLATKNPLVRVLPVGVAQGSLLHLLLHVGTCDLAAYHSWGKSHMPGTEDTAGMPCA